MVISNEDINTLPIETFPGKIIVVDNQELVKEACTELSKNTIIGFDTESKPTFKKGETVHLSLIQMSLYDKCYLFRINKLKNVPNELIDIFMSKRLKLVGLSLNDDFQKIRKMTSKIPQNALDIQNVVGKYGLEEKSLKKLYAILFHKRITKRQQLSNWGADTLSLPQQMYAALDAWACLQIYDKLETINPKYLDLKN